jgi:hypothetical protein
MLEALRMLPIFLQLRREREHELVDWSCMEVMHGAAVLGRDRKELTR